MKSTCTHLRSSAANFLLIFLSFIMLSGPVRPGAADDSIIPGVQILDALSDRAPIPPGLAAEVIEINWTDPELKVELLGGGASIVTAASGSDEGGGSGGDAVGKLPSWRNLLRRYPDALLIGMENAEARPSGADYATVGDLLPWNYQGATIRERNGFESPLSAHDDRVGLLWLGRPGEWRDSELPNLKNTLLFSTFDPATGRSRFVLINNPGQRARETREIGLWIDLAVRDTNWVALHARGSAGRIFLAGEEITPQAQPKGLYGTPEAVLMVRRRGTGDEIDWARQTRTRTRASSSERRLEPALLTSGVLWNDFAPPAIWTSKPPKGRDLKIAWIELTPGHPKPVRQIRLIYPSAVGWSRQFNPARLKVEVWEASGDKPILVEEIDDGAGRDVAVIELAQPTDVRRVRIEFTEPNAMGIPGRARMAGVRLLGPFAGR